MYWPKLTSEEINSRISQALHRNINYRELPILGIPGSYLDAEVFYEDALFLENAPFLSTLVANPNHIGCHTLGNTEKIFRGTQELEKELINLCAEQIFGGSANEQDGYIASGGTEANIEAMWIYRNYFLNVFDAKVKEIALVFSEDSHYSLFKSVNLLNICPIVIKVSEHARELLLEDLEKKIDLAQTSGIKYFIININMSTTLFGSVDDIDNITSLLNKKKINYKLHVDAAFGGFIYPFTNTKHNYSFKNPDITSFTVDAHKMLQTPYGTGIFLIRKGYMQYVKTSEAQYVSGTDYTLCGSRSGANAVAVWMVLHNHGSEGWKTKMQVLADRTTDICCQLDKIGVRYFRNSCVNIIAIRASDIPGSIAEKYFLVPDSYEQKPKWWKIVVMPHIKRGTIDSFILELKSVSKTQIVNE